MRREFNALDESFASQLFDKVRHASRMGIGVTRPSYSAIESNVIDILGEVASHEGLLTMRDEAANLRVNVLHDLPPEPTVWIGSHLDSVPQGGNYDGLAGVIAGLLVLRKIKENRVTPPRPVTVIGLRGEESAWFGIPYIGSKALFGKLTEMDLGRPFKNGGLSLRDHMRLQGASSERIAIREVFVDPADIAEFWELHIEQGPVLVERKLPVGLVTTIRGNIRHANVQIVGQAGHSGTTPPELRHDAVFAFADFLSRLDASWKGWLDCDRDLVVTCGMVSTDDTVHGLTRIPESVKFCLEWRSHDNDMLESFAHSVRATSGGTEKRYGVGFNFDVPVHTPSVALDTKLVERAQLACTNLDLPTMRLPSGAGHDAAVFAGVGVPSGMIFVRNENGSHNPREAMDMNDFMAGVEVLYKVVTARV